ncbi:TATA-box binding protein (TBP) (component of TFIID and TFIIIB) [Algoriphagus iocasae]|jgi:TATA-box binding protein (TBP) (component of TFIID and TFIIIB)|uniref:TATA-box binding protein (TBP) (Component of TFIID and TFIIIB) n=1 Tax=Algoriphagus iocasae TaxID=1836499 RepID=A0A841MJW1_9BACT|nr:DUF4136 domain-containing protein [Algoriphagus iocasae]MBB6325134.1 TATA-box binding protein (TBP) (component of TFIID and TFIIIB) [Algoriphagus iocasae]
MKNLLLVAGILFTLISCKTSENITVDQVSNNSGLSGKKTFQVITKADAPKDILMLNKLFEKKMKERGYSKDEHNPDFLVQSVIASIDYEKEVLGYGSVGNAFSTMYYPVKLESEKYGKVIFLIQDAETYEVLWMGTGTGVLTEKELIDKGSINSALDQLIAELK